MKFLCIHGNGSNNAVMELQTGNSARTFLAFLRPRLTHFAAGLRYELEDQYEYEFVEAAVAVPMAADVTSLASPGQSFFGFYRPADFVNLRTAVDQLEDYIRTEGPFDGVLGFSAGCVVAALHILEMQRRREQQYDSGGAAVAGNDQPEPPPLPFRCAIFVCSAAVRGALEFLGGDPQAERIRIPTVHVMGSSDGVEPTGGQELSQLCDPVVRTVLVHDGGHEFPKGEQLIEMSHAIQRGLDVV
ncbi:serine hydrolase FSH [Apiospora marii]|uniref:Serine hydrolase FSH n=1 Tax=Apiospora marii TaxID=335849 RepID=A0ABR1S9K1_9PEZI